MPIRRGLGGRASPRPSELVTTLEPGDRLILCSDGVIKAGAGRAASVTRRSPRLRFSEDGSAADTVRKVTEPS